MTQVPVEEPEEVETGQECGQDHALPPPPSLLAGISFLFLKLEGHGDPAGIANNEQCSYRTLPFLNIAEDWEVCIIALGEYSKKGGQIQILKNGTWSQNFLTGFSNG